jgi:Arc/MetJ-type ribon-helix-helix transcriptional regulator
MERVSFRLPEDLLDEVDAAVDAGVFPNRSEAIREAIRGEFPTEDGEDDQQVAMTDGGEDREGVRVSSGAPDLHAFVSVPHQYAQTEVVVESDSPPTVVRQYRGMDHSGGQPHRRHVSLIKGGATREQDRPVEFQINEDAGLTRIVVSGTETAVGVLKSVLSSGEYERVDGGEDDG